MFLKKVQQVQDMWCVAVSVCRGLWIVPCLEVLCEGFAVGMFLVSLGSLFPELSGSKWKAVLAKRTTPVGIAQSHFYFNSYYLIKPKWPTWCPPISACAEVWLSVIFHGPQPACSINRWCTAPPVSERQESRFISVSLWHIWQNCCHTFTAALNGHILEFQGRGR